MRAWHRVSSARMRASEVDRGTHLHNLGAVRIALLHSGRQRCAGACVEAVVRWQVGESRRAHLGDAFDEPALGKLVTSAQSCGWAYDT